MRQCPDCHAPLTFDSAADVSTTIYRQAPGRMPYVDETTRRAAVVFCSGCEYVRELTALEARAFVNLVDREIPVKIIKSTKTAAAAKAAKKVPAAKKAALVVNHKPNGAPIVNGKPNGAPAAAPELTKNGTAHPPVASAAAAEPLTNGKRKAPRAAKPVPEGDGRCPKCGRFNGKGKANANCGNPGACKHRIQAAHDYNTFVAARQPQGK